MKRSPKIGTREVRVCSLARVCVILLWLGAGDGEVLDDGEIFDNLEMQRVMEDDPESLAYFNAKKNITGHARRPTGGVKVCGCCCVNLTRFFDFPGSAGFSSPLNKTTLKSETLLNELPNESQTMFLFALSSSSRSFS